MSYLRNSLLLMLLAAAYLPAGQIVGQDVPSRAPGQLPWEKSPVERIEPTFRPPANALEILERYDIGRSQFDGFFDGQPLERSEEDVLVKILYRFSRIGLENLERWRRKDVTWDQLAAAPAAHRSEVFHLRGRATLVRKQLLIPEQSALYDYTHYYQVRIKLDESPYTALVCARKVPSAWKLEEPIDEPATVDGLFLKLGYEMSPETPLGERQAEVAPPAGVGLDDTRLICAAGRVAWLPDRVQPKDFIGPDQLQLARYGVDIGLLADVRAGNGKPIGDGDREAFYQILSALGRVKPVEMRRPHVAEPIDIGPLLKTDPELHGQIMPVRGIARRIVKVLVDDKDIRKRFGIDHYYEIDLFMPLGNSRVVLGKDRTGEKNPVYEDDFPATLIVRRLPTGMKEGENLRQLVRANAVFFKIWSYRSTYASKYGVFQPAPMFLAVEPVPFEEDLSKPNWIAEGMVGASLGLAILILFSVFWWYRRADRQYQKALSNTLADSLVEKPDFRGLQ